MPQPKKASDGAPSKRRRLKGVPPRTNYSWDTRGIWFSAADVTRFAAIGGLPRLQSDPELVADRLTEAVQSARQRAGRADTTPKQNEVLAWLETVEKRSNELLAALGFQPGIDGRDLARYANKFVDERGSWFRHLQDGSYGDVPLFLASLAFPLGALYGDAAKAANSEASFQHKVDSTLSGEDDPTAERAAQFIRTNRIVARNALQNAPAHIGLMSILAREASQIVKQTPNRGAHGNSNVLRQQLFFELCKSYEFAFGRLPSVFVDGERDGAGIDWFMAVLAHVKRRRPECACDAVAEHLDALADFTPETIGKYVQDASAAVTGTKRGTA